MPIIPSSRYQGWHYSVAEAFMSPLRSQGAPYLSHQPLSIPQPFPSPSPTSPTSLAPSHARPRPPLPPRFPGPDVSEPVAKPRPFPPSPVCPEYSPQLSDSGCSPPGGRTAPNPLPPSRAPGRSSPASPGPIGPVPGSSGQSRAGGAGGCRVVKHGHRARRAAAGRASPSPNKAAGSLGTPPGLWQQEN